MHSDQVERKERFGLRINDEGQNKIALRFYFH